MDTCKITDKNSNLDIANNVDTRYNINNKGKETDTAEERREDTWQPAAKQGTETTTPHKPQTEQRSQERKPDGQGTGTTAGASHRRGANPTPEPPRGEADQPNPTTRREGRRQRRQHTHTTPPPHSSHT